MRKGAAAVFFTLFSAKRSYSPLKKAHLKIPQKSAESIAEGHIKFRKGTV